MLAEICLMLIPSFYALNDAQASILNNWLSQPVLNSSESKAEIQKFLKDRIPPLVVPDNAEEWKRKSEEMREEIFDRVVFRNVPREWYVNNPRVFWGDVIETEKGYKIRKLRYEALPGLWIPALLYEPAEEKGKIPAILNVNGHVGPPGKTIDYEQIRCINLAKRGMLALHPEWLVFGELGGNDFNHNRLAYLDLCGSSGLSVFYLAMKRGIDVLESHPWADVKRIGMTGLSGGGWQTIILSSLDTRIAATAPNAGYIGLECRIEHRADIGDLEQNPNDLLTIGDYPHLTAMLADRKALLIYNEKDDCCFQSYRAKPSVYDPVKPFFVLFGNEGNFLYHENTVPGTHNYDKDNREQFYKFVNRCFLSESEWVDSEIPSDDEVLTYEDLIVGIPENNANFFTLASELMKNLPKNNPPMDDSAEFQKWQAEARDKLQEILRLKPAKASGAVVREAVDGKLKAKWYKLSVNEVWSIPAVALSPAENPSGDVAIVMSDKGKRTLREQVEELTGKGMTVLTVDPLFIGECMPEDCPFSQLAMMVSTGGERTLGIQTGQMGAIIEWACQEFKVDKVSLCGIGWSTSVLAITACGLHSDKVKDVFIKDYPESLKKLIEDHVDYEQRPALFCFGLLEQFDIAELEALCKPVKIFRKQEN